MTNMVNIWLTLFCCKAFYRRRTRFIKYIINTGSGNLNKDNSTKFEISKLTAPNIRENESTL